MRSIKILLVIGALSTAFFLGIMFFITQWPVIDFSVLEQYSPARGSIVLDDKGEELCRFQYDRREMVHISDIPPQLINAFLAAEDHAFFEHSGVSFRAIIRSFFVNLVNRRVVQGASTITQQLVKLLFTDSKRTFTRKIKEQFLAVLVEKQFSKEQILQTYLNHIYFGCGIYGVEAAAQRFWGISVRDITIDQAAVLAGIIRSPGKYCPLLEPENSLSVRNSVLRSMVQLKSITQAQYEAALSRDLAIIPAAESGPLAPYFKEHIRLFLEDLLGKKALYKDGFVIQTTLNKQVQKAAEETFLKALTHYKKTIHRDLNGGLMTLDVHTGEIKALIGGTSFSESPFNRATQAHRQMGSTFKPLVYLAAINQGMGFDQVAIDEPIMLTDAVGTVWTPKNVNKKFIGPMTLALALSRSNNMVAIKTFLTVGPESVISLARQAGITAAIKPYPSTALGTPEATVQEVAGYWNIFANNGVYVKPHCIRWIKNSWGDKVWKYKPELRRVAESPVVGQVAKVLTISLEKAKARQEPEERLFSDALGKSGTTNDSRTCWFVGSTPQYTTALYLGSDRNESLGENILSFNTTYPVWHALMKKIDLTQKFFTYDRSLEAITINQYIGERVASNDPTALSILINPLNQYPPYAPNPLPPASLTEEELELAESQE